MRKGRQYASTKKLLAFCTKGGGMDGLGPNCVGHGPLGAASTRVKRANRWSAMATLPATIKPMGRGLGATVRFFMGKSTLVGRCGRQAPVHPLKLPGILENSTPGSQISWITPAPPLL